MSSLGKPALDQQRQWLRVKAVFLEVIERPAAERDTALGALCAGDDALRREVVSLLASEAQAGELLEQSARSLLDDGEPSDWRPRLAPQSRLGPYEIGEFIAAGGMGEVYRAQHTVLGRPVAIKTVSGDLTDPSARRRLIREAKHAATLSHKNICTIYEVGESAEQPFIAMELLHGHSLRALLREGPIDIPRALRIGIQVSDALAHAHERGIIHRDLKSSNVIIDTTGRAIVLDFGLSKRLVSATGDAQRDSTLTHHGVIAGTLSHMAPEVLQGAESDIQSDIWALGVLLYELTTRELPFRGRTSYETSAAILSEAPQGMDSRVPLALRLVIERCLHKHPASRYTRAADVRDALEAIERRRSWPLIGRLLIATRRRTILLAVAAAVAIPALVWGGVRMLWLAGIGTPVPTIAVLPLANATGDSASGYFADGLTDGLIAELGATSKVRVIARSSTSRIAADTKSLESIGKRLGAAMLVEGSLRRSSGRVAVNIRIVDPRDSRMLWADAFDRDASNILALQADVVRALALAIRLTGRPGAESRLATVRAVRPDVYEEFLKGRFEWNQRTPPSLRRAVGHFTRAVELDPTYAPAHAALADCYNQLGTVMVGSGSPQQFRPLAAGEAIKALQLDPLSSEAHAALGYTKHYDLHWSEADREFQRAIELNPSYALAHVWYANLLMSRRRFTAALREVNIARELDPFSLVINTNVGWILDVSGRHEQAVDQYRVTLALDSGYVQAHMRMAGALVSAGKSDEGVAEAEHVMKLAGRTPSTLGMLGSVYGMAGRTDEAMKVANELIALRRTQYVPAWSIGGIFGGMGDTARAEEWAERAIVERSNAVAYFGVERIARVLRGNGRIRQLIAGADAP